MSISYVYHVHRYVYMAGHLLALGSPAVHGHALHAQAPAEAVGLRLRLLRQLARRRHDQQPGPVALRPDALLRHH